ncbi:MAG: biopolymer transporter ExbD [Deferribacteres bacterium]|nr:biopolymer transporter ExbD [candidate division KSB1 bacterium]MCB9509243.1 biopolymer transporter ExbD [Deferribacteres bacterium]
MLNLNTNKFALGSRRSKNRNNQVNLRLTSMIDMFTILLVFLLKSYSAEGQIITVTKDLRLPDSTAETPPISTPIVKVTQQTILLDDEPVADLRQTYQSKDLEIAGLSQLLADRKILAERLGNRDASLGFKGNVTIQGDREIEFRILKKIMFTCGKVGYNNIYLAVTKQE